MEQLTMYDLKEYIKALENRGLDLKNLPVYLGNDDELNGIHNGWCITYLDKNSKNEDIKYLVEMTQEDYATTDLQDKGILIS